MVIDVPDNPADLMGNLDWDICHPRVLLVVGRAAEGNRQAPDAWEPTLTSQGYEFVLYDGLCRYYVSREGRALREELATPVNCFDSYVRAEHPMAVDRALAQILETPQLGRGHRIGLTIGLTIAKALQRLRRALRRKHSKATQPMPIAGPHVSRGRGAPTPPRKPRLVLLTPFPPDQSGVAHCMRAGIPAIAQHATIDVFTDAPDPWPTEGVRAFWPISNAPYLSTEYDRVIAIMGNSPLHQSTLHHLRHHGGPCIAHDARLTEFYAATLGVDGLAAMAQEALLRPITISEPQAWLESPATSPSTFFHEILAASSPLIVHSRGIQDHIASQYGSVPEYLPFYCYTPFSEKDLSQRERQKARARLAIDGDKIVLASFGIQSETKRLSDCLRITQHLRDSGLPVELHLVGNATGCQPDLDDRIRRLGLSRHVVCHNHWLADRTYRDYLIAADYGVHFRAYDFGQISGALSDCISAGLPTFANQALAAMLDAPPYVHTTPDEFSTTAVAKAIAQAIENDLHTVSRVSNARAAYLEDHSVERYARGLMDVLGLT